MEKNVLSECTAHYNKPLTEEKDSADIHLPQYLTKKLAYHLFQLPLPGNSVNIIWK